MEGKTEIDITTFRQEGPYLDHRHPSSITFTRDPKEDYRPPRLHHQRALYHPKGRGFGLLAGPKGPQSRPHSLYRRPRNPDRRRSLTDSAGRTFRGKKLGFSIEPKSKAAIEKLRPLLSTLNPEKVKMELLKEPK
jgi:tRNA nucleotidyltransferase (CCA-adding enzyme)